MKRFSMVSLALVVLWPAMTLAGGKNATQKSHAVQSSYKFTVIAEFDPPFGGTNLLTPSEAANGPIITEDGTIVFSTGNGTASFIFSGDGTATRQLIGLEHTFVPLDISVSGNGMMVTNRSRNIIDIYDGTILGLFDAPGDDFGVGSGLEGLYHVSINNRGSVAFTGGHRELCAFNPQGSTVLDYDGGVFRFDGDKTTTIAEYGTFGWMYTVVAFPSINESGRVAFRLGSAALGNYCPSTVGLEDGYLFVGDGKRLVQIGEANSAPSLNNHGDVGFIGLSDGALSVLVSDGKKTRIVADTRGAFTDFPGTEFDPGLGWPNGPRIGVSINDRGEVAFVATVHGVGDGIFTGPDVERDKVIACGDLLAGSSVSGGIILSRQSLNKKGQIAFQATLADGRKVIVRAEREPGMN